MRMFFLK